MIKTEVLLFSITIILINIRVKSELFYFQGTAGIIGFDL